MGYGARAGAPVFDGARRILFPGARPTQSINYSRMFRGKVFDRGKGVRGKEKGEFVDSSLHRSSPFTHQTAIIGVDIFYPPRFIHDKN